MHGSNPRYNRKGTDLMIYLIDTNICIYIMNQRPPDVIHKFKQMDVGMVGLSAITVSELSFGVAKSSHPQKNMTRLNEFLAPFEVLPYDDKAALVYGKVRSGLERRGMVIGPLDMLIAAHAMSRDLILVTNNEKEFHRIETLKTENWVSQL